MSKITIKVWMNSGANHQSTYRAEFEIDAAEWNGMYEDEKEECAKEYAWQRMDWGWAIKENP